jgi:hypothetical protein
MQDKERINKGNDRYGSIRIRKTKERPDKEYG